MAKNRATRGTLIAGAFDDNPAKTGANKKLMFAKATYDFAVHGGAIGAIGLGVFIPANAIIVDSLIQVITTCKTADADAGTMAISVLNANDIVSAIAVSDASNPWDAGLHAGVPVGSAATSIALSTTAKEITATIATKAFTAGKFNVFLQYVIGG